ncbi:MAG TPA: hypothetical protein VJZ00_04900 [Thermoanaerobaculia bacterium]|nr:hypothetical protein [Thermoanaerobaculia bacterium]
MSELLTVVLGIVLIAMVVVFLKVRQKDLVAAFMEKRRANSKLVCRADYVEGVEKIPVALSLTETALYYENPDLEASFDLDRIDEIEYSQDLATGRSHDTNHEVLRLRSHGATFEFLLEKADCAKWMQALPPRTLDGRATARAV